MATSPFSVLAGGQSIPANTVSPFLALSGSPITPINMATPFYKLLPTPTQPLPTSTNILSGLADARTNGVADDRSWFQKLIDSVSNTQSQSGSDNSKPVRMAPYGTEQKVTDSTPKETVAEKGAKADQQIALQKQANTPKGNNDQTANVNAASQASTIMDVAKGFVGQSKPGDIPQQQAGTPTASSETPTGLAGLFADPRVQMALLGFGSGLANNMAGGQAMAQGAGQFFQEVVRQAGINAATEEKKYQRSQDELKNKREDRKVLNDEEKTKIDQQKADSLAKLQQAQADAATAGIEMDKRRTNAYVSKMYADIKRGKSETSALKDKDYATMYKDYADTFSDPEEARYRLNDALPEGARRYANLTSEKRTEIQNRVNPTLQRIKELEGKKTITPSEAAELKAAKSSAADILDYYGIIYGNVNWE